MYCTYIREEMGNGVLKKKKKKMARYIRKEIYVCVMCMVYVHTLLFRILIIRNYLILSL